MAIERNKIRTFRDNNRLPEDIESTRQAKMERIERAYEMSAGDLKGLSLQETEEDDGEFKVKKTEITGNLNGLPVHIMVEAHYLNEEVHHVTGTAQLDGKAMDPYEAPALFRSLVRAIDDRDHINNRAVKHTWNMILWNPDLRNGEQEH